MRVILEALNAWAKEPHSLTLRRSVSNKMDKYREAINKGFFTPCGRCVFRRDRADSVTEEELSEAVCFLLKRRASHAKSNMPPWEE